LLVFRIGQRRNIKRGIPRTYYKDEIRYADSVEHVVCLIWDEGEEVRR